MDMLIICLSSLSCRYRSKTRIDIGYGRHVRCQSVEFLHAKCRELLCHIHRLLLECAEHRELPDAGELRERRRKLKVTQAAAADALGVSAARVSTLERGVTVDSALAERYSGLLDELERERPL